MPDPASLSVSLPIAWERTNVTADGDRVCRFQVREVLWGNDKRFVVRDTATNTTVAIRAMRQVADSDLIRLNWATRSGPDSGTAFQPVVNDSTSELIAGGPTHRQCGRCRQFFVCDSALNPAAVQEWWLCEPCRDRLMGTGRAPTTTDPVGSTAHTGSSCTAPASPTAALAGRSDVG